MKIDKGVPIPPSKGRGRNSTYPFPDMEIGDSFFAEEVRASMAAYQYGRRHGMEFSRRKEGGGIRIWRTA